MCPHVSTLEAKKTTTKAECICDGISILGIHGAKKSGKTTTEFGNNRSGDGSGNNCSFGNEQDDS